MKDTIKMMESQLSEDTVRKVHVRAELEILAIRLAQLREEQNIKQSEMSYFSQKSISRLESGKDMKISTLINYLDNLRMELEILAYSKDNKSFKKVLLKN